MIEMLASTCYNGQQYAKGKTYTIDETTEKRWIKNGIAEKSQDLEVQDTKEPEEKKPDEIGPEKRGPGRPPKNA